MRHLKHELSKPFLWIHAHFAQWDTLPQVWATAVKLIMNCRLVMFYCNSPHDNEAAHMWGERATATIWECVPQGWSKEQLDRAPDLFHLIPLKIAPARVFSTNHWVVRELVCSHTRTNPSHCTFVTHLTACTHTCCTYTSNPPGGAKHATVNHIVFVQKGRCIILLRHLFMCVHESASGKMMASARGAPRHTDYNVVCNAPPTQTPHWWEH